MSLRSIREFPSILEAAAAVAKRRIAIVLEKSDALITVSQFCSV